MLPDGWQLKTLGETATLQRGIDLPVQDRKYGDVPIYGSNGIVGYHNHAPFPAGGVITGRSGTIGSVFYSETPYHPLNTALHVSDFHGNHPRFIANLLAFLDLKQFVAATGVPTLNRNFIHPIEVKVPPVLEQKRIAGILGSVDAAIEATKAVIDQTKTVKQGLLQTLLTRGIGHTKFKDSPLGEIPEAWEVLRLADAKVKVIDGDRGSAYPKADDFSADGFCLFLSAKNVSKNGFAFDDCQFITATKHKELRKGLLTRGDIVITTRGTIGNLAYYDERIPFDWIRINSGMVILRNERGKLWTDYFLALMKSDVVEKQISEMSFGSAQQQLTVKILNDLTLPVPPIDEQKIIALRFNEVEEFYNTEIQKLATLQTLKKGLMGDLLTGTVRVENAAVAKTSTSNVVPFALTAPVDAVRKHAVLSAEITAQLYHLNTFGATKREKLTDLVVRHVGLDETTDRQASRHAAGSYDPKARREIDDIFEREHWFKIQRGASAVKFLKGTAFGAHKAEFEEQFGSVKLQVQKVINLLRDYDTRHCEIVDTLYTAWNDFLIEGKSPNDDEIISEVLTNWHDSKLNISRQDWRSGLTWMRERDFVPSGRGRSTKQKTLL